MKRPFRTAGQTVLLARELSSGWRPRIIHGLLLGILVFSATRSPACAQVTAAISGHVEDPSGAAVSGATVTVKNLETGATRVVNTDEAGDFRVLSLPLGPQE